MASTFSSLLRIELIGTGDQSGTWGNTTNTNLGTLIEQAIAGTAIVDVSVGNVTLSTVNGSSDQSRCAAVRVIGTPGVPRNIIAPALSHIYVVANGSDNTVTIKTSTSTGVTVPVGEVYLVYYDSNIAVADFRLVGRAASSTNTANTLVLRDSSGNFAANIVTADLVGNVTGNIAGSVNGPVGNVVPNTGAFTTLSSSGNTTLGDASGDTLTVNATPTFNVAIPVGSGGTGATTITGLVKGNGTSAFTAAASGVDYAPATTGTNTQLLANNGTGGFSNVSLAPSLSYAGGTLSVVSGGGMVYPAAGIPLSSGTSWGTSFNNTTNPITVAYGGTGATTAATARTNLGATTVGSNFFTLTNPSAVTFIRVNADNTVSTLDAASFRTAIGAGSGGGTVTSITAGSFLTGGTITTSGTIAVDATSLNTASKVVARDASGNFSAGTITANLSGNATSATTATTATSATTATTATTATNLAGGGAGQVPYNSASGTTAFLAAGFANQVLQSNGAAAPSWVSSVNLATNIEGGAAGRIPYNTGSGATSFISAGTSGQLLQSNGSGAPTWTSGKLVEASTGSALYYGARAWVNFTGLTTASILGSVNVSSVARNSAGNYSINLTTAMPDTNGAIVDSYSNVGSNADQEWSYWASASQIVTLTSLAGTSNRDVEFVYIAVFR